MSVGSELALFFNSKEKCIMKIQKNYDLVEIITEDGDKYTRIFDKMQNKLTWANEYKHYTLDFETKRWMLYTKRKGYVDIDGECWLEIEYKKQIRIKKMERLIDDE